MTAAATAAPAFRFSPASLVLPVGALALIVLMVLPIPTPLLDAFFVLNIALALAVLMAAMNAVKPLDFSSFPSVLLFATLLRLALNVASTRIVLVQGHQGEGAAGEVIASFGQFLVAGNFAVGLFVFVILLIINMVVITKGAGRVSEVSARFTLDALPGKQMAIDSDIAAGILTGEEAKARRAEIATEADFYGAMDGASKFVKGDAIAALLILLVNVFAGFIIGMAQHDLSAGDAAQVYVTLAVGDALVAQVPALLLSIAAAVIVTRVTDKADLAGHVGGQLASPRVWLPVALVLGAMGTIPAMPQLVFLPAAAAAFALSRTLATRERTAATAAAAPEPPPGPEAIAIDEVSDHTLVTIELGFALVPLVDEKRGAPLVARVAGVRKQLSGDHGFVVPRFRIRDSLHLPPDSYRITLGGVAVAEAALRPGRLLAIDTGDVPESAVMAGEATLDPSFGCPAVWIDPAAREDAEATGYMVVEPATVLATHLAHAIGRRPEALLGTEEVQAVLDALKARMPGLVEAVTPEPLSLAALTRTLRALLAEGLTLAHPVPVFASLASALVETKEPGALIDRVRIDCGAAIAARVAPPGDALPVVTLSAELEGAILGGLRDPATGEPLVDPSLGGRIAREIEAIVAARDGEGRVALIVQPPARRPVAALLGSRVPQAVVMAIGELPATRAVEVVAVVGDENVVAPQLEMAA